MNRARQLSPLLLALLADLSSAADSDPFAGLASESRPLTTRWQTDYAGSLRLGGAWVSDDNFMFGQYNGLADEGAKLLGSLSWADYSNAGSRWALELNDLGLATREGRLDWHLGQRLKLEFTFDAQRQVRNDSGATPFRGTTDLRLPAGWQSGLITSRFDSLQTDLRGLSRELDRDRYRLALEGRLSENWSAYGSLQHEEKRGTGDIGAGVYVDASGADAVVLPLPVDYEMREGELGLRFDGARVQLDGQIHFSDFDNAAALLQWQNPYSSYSPAVHYPQGTAGLALAPDNDQWRGRLNASWAVRDNLRLTVDASHALASQDQALLDYSVNPRLTVREPVPRSHFDGEVATDIVHGKLWWRPLAPLDVELWYRSRERDYDVPRDRYLYIRGDGASQPRDELAVYNVARDLLSQTFGGEARYRLDSRQRLSAQYEYEKIERRNMAVEETEEGRVTFGYRLRLTPGLQARLALTLADRAASTYHWEQSYYALLDAGLINLTPDRQRYINHPDFSQYYLANRERLDLKADLSYQPAPAWQLNLNLQWRDDDYDKSELGITDRRWWRAQLSASYALGDQLSASLYGGFDRFETDQRSRAFRGGQEKNAFVAVPPLPQASDPGRNWSLAAEDDSINLGGSLQWQPRERLEFTLDYSYVDTRARQSLSAGSAASLTPADLPDVDTRRHQLILDGQWHLRDNLSLILEYQYYRYHSDDWAWQGVTTNSLDKVLGLGDRNPNESIHYMGLSAVYRWQ